MGDARQYKVSTEGRFTSGEAEQIEGIPGQVRSVKLENNTNVGSGNMCKLGGMNGDDCEQAVPTRPAKPAFYKSVRYGIMVLALISPFVVNYSKTIINFAITDMILKKTVTESEISSTGVINESASIVYYFESDNSCPVDNSTRTRLIEDQKRDILHAESNSGDKFEWDTFQQGLLKGAYFYGSAPLQVPGSRLSEIYGSHSIMSACSLMIGLGCLLAPLLASMSFYLLLMDLVFMGVMGSFMTPALITLFANWLTPGEKTMVISSYIIASRLGFALSSWLSFTLISAQLSWRYIFYSAGVIGITFSTLFFLCARSRPIDHPLISKMELDYLTYKNNLVREAVTKRKKKLEAVEMKSVSGDSELQAEGEVVGKKSKKPPAPWLAILTSVPVWAFITTKFCVKLACDTVSIELPTYLKTVMHLDASANNFINTSNYVIFCVGCFSVGLFAKLALKKRPFGLSKTVLRKIFQGTASFGVATLLFGIAHSICDQTMTTILLMCLFYITTFGTGGEAQIPVDITERYSGTVHAIGSSIAISGAIEPTIVGYFLKGHGADRDRWKYVWLGASAIAFFGGLVFVLFGDATVQPFDSIDTSSKGGQPTKLPTMMGADNESFEPEVNSVVRKTKRRNEDEVARDDRETGKPDEHQVDPPDYNESTRI